MQARVHIIIAIALLAQLPAIAIVEAAPITSSNTIVAAGDIGDCTSTGDTETAALVAAAPDATVLTLGDHAYDNGSRAEFANCYTPTWGPFVDRTQPSPGNHDYLTPGATGYKSYFDITGPTWYGFDVGDWRVISLDSNCTKIGGCGPGSVEYTWLKAELAANDGRCTLAYWHHPRWSSGFHGDYDAVDKLWGLLARDGDVKVVLNGHEHDYERFAPLDAAGNPSVDGVREFVVGTGGTDLRPVSNPRAHSEFVDDQHHGILAMDLESNGYSWEFRTSVGVLDSGEAAAPCGEDLGEMQSPICDFDGDGFGDLAVGAPYEMVGIDGEAGAIAVLRGSLDGLTSVGNLRFHQDSPGIHGGPEPGDAFGYATTCGDFDGDGYSDLAVGVPFEDVGSAEDAGALHLLYGSRAGLTSAGSIRWNQDTAGIKGIVESGD